MNNRLALILVGAIALSGQTESQGATQPVVLTLYVHANTASGPVISGAQVTGSDAVGTAFNQTTGSTGFVTLSGQPGTWQFTAAAAGYQPNSWSQGITTTQSPDAFLQPASVTAAPTISSGPTATPNFARAGQSISFAVVASSPSGAIADFDWDFADGVHASGAALSSYSHAFAAGGTYKVTVTVSDAKGGTASGTITVTVMPGAKVTETPNAIIMFHPATAPTGSGVQDPFVEELIAELKSEFSAFAVIQDLVEEGLKVKPFHGFLIDVVEGLFWPSQAGQATTIKPLLKQKSTDVVLADYAVVNWAEPETVFFPYFEILVGDDAGRICRDLTFSVYYYSRVTEPDTLFSRTTLVGAADTVDATSYEPGSTIVIAGKSGIAIGSAPGTYRIQASAGNMSGVHDVTVAIVNVSRLMVSLDQPAANGYGLMGDFDQITGVLSATGSKKGLSGGLMKFDWGTGATPARAGGGASGSVPLKGGLTGMKGKNTTATLTLRGMTTVRSGTKNMRATIKIRGSVNKSTGAVTGTYVERVTGSKTPVSGTWAGYLWGITNDLLPEN